MPRVTGTHRAWHKLNTEHWAVVFQPGPGSKAIQSRESQVRSKSLHAPRKYRTGLPGGGLAASFASRVRTHHHGFV